MRLQEHLWDSLFNYGAKFDVPRQHYRKVVWITIPCPGSSHTALHDDNAFLGQNKAYGKPITAFRAPVIWCLKLTLRHSWFSSAAAMYLLFSPAHAGCVISLRHGRAIDCSGPDRSILHSQYKPNVQVAHTKAWAHMMTQLMGTKFCAHALITMDSQAMRDVFRYQMILRSTPPL